jgi:uncharacterized membrane protein
VTILNFTLSIAFELLVEVVYLIIRESDVQITHEPNKLPKVYLAITVLVYLLKKEVEVSQRTLVLAQLLTQYDTD